MATKFLRDQHSLRGFAPRALETDHFLVARRCAILPRCRPTRPRACIAFLLLFVAFVLSAPSPVAGHADALMALPGERCLVPPQNTWKSPEKWAWTEICEGRPADFDLRPDDERPDTGEDLAFDPADPDFEPASWNGRTLRSMFLETVLMHEPFRSAVPHYGIHIKGAYFPQIVGLADASIDRRLALTNSRFESEVDLSRLSTSTLLSFDDSVFRNELHLDSASIDGDLSMTGAEFEALSMNRAWVRDQVTLVGAEVRGPLHMDSISIGGDLFLIDIPGIGEAILRGAQIGDQLGIVDVVFEGLVDLDSAVVGGDLIVRGGTEFQGRVQLRGIEVGDQLSMEGIEFARELDLGAAAVGGSVLMQGVTVRWPLNMRFLRVGRNLDVRGAAFTCRVDLTGARIEGSLRLGDERLPAIRWEDQGCTMILENARVGGLADTNKTWPDHLELNGFVYGRLDRFGAGYSEDGTLTDGSWFEEWLAKDSSYSPQPYRHLAQVLRSAGREDIADDVLFAGRERESTEIDFGWRERLRLCALKLVIGYGLRPGRALVGIAALVLFGTGILWLFGVKERGFWYSLDMTLPIIRLREEHYTKDLEAQPGDAKWKPISQLARYVRPYFYGHQLLGYVLIFFVIAALSGLVE